MKRVAKSVLMFAVAVTPARSGQDSSIQAMVGGLASGDYRKREVASNWLKAHPEAARALHAAMKSADPETKARAAVILAYYEERPLRELRAAASGGRIDRFIEILSAWPTGKLEHEAWTEICNVASKLAKYRFERTGVNVKPVQDRWMPQNWDPVVTTGRLITEKTERTDDLACYVRAQEVNVARSRRRNIPHRYEIEAATAFVVARTIRIDCTRDPLLMLAGGSVEIIPGSAVPCPIIVSGGDVTITTELSGALLIARGKIYCTSQIRDRSCLIAGKTVTLDYFSDTAIISENDANPLGYIRWADTPKQKTPAKKK